jgi:hypothetical protein
MVASVELQLPTALAAYLIDTGMATLPGEPSTAGRRRSAVADVLIVAAGVTTTVITTLQGPNTVVELVRLMRTWRRSDPTTEGLELTVSVTKTKRVVHVVVPRNSDLGDVARLLHEVAAE